MYVCMYVCMRGSVRACVHACMHVCMHVCMYVDFDQFGLPYLGVVPPLIPVGRLSL